MGSKKRSYSRRAASISPRASILVLTEGSVTEVEYLSRLKSCLRIPKGLLEIRASRCSDALGAVEEALSLKRTVKGTSETIDEVWVLADTESEQADGRPENINKAVNRAGKKVFLVLDSPSIEYWFLLHFERTTRCYSNCQEVVSDLVKYIPGYSKRSQTCDWSLLMDKSKSAFDNANLVRSSRRSSAANRPIADCDVLVARLVELAEAGAYQHLFGGLDDDQEGKDSLPGAHELYTRERF